MGVVVSGLSDNDSTVYAPGYSDGGFRKVTVGMHRSDVLDLLGPPVHYWNYEGRFWGEWAYSPEDGDYRRREIAFRNDIVVEKLAEYWLD